MCQETLCFPPSFPFCFIFTMQILTQKWFDQLHWQPNRGLLLALEFITTQYSRICLAVSMDCHFWFRKSEDAFWIRAIICLTWPLLRLTSQLCPSAVFAQCLPRVATPSLAVILPGPFLDQVIGSYFAYATWFQSKEWHSYFVAVKAGGGGAIYFSSLRN